MKIDEIQSLFTDDVYTCNGRKGWPYLCTRADHKYKGDTVIFFYGITPKGNRSHYWTAYWIDSRIKNAQKERMLQRYIETGLPKLPRGYRWSDPRRYS